MSFLPYLFFGGNCRQAFTRYEEIFGGELQIMTAADAPAEGGASDDGEGMFAPDSDLVIHAALSFADHLLMGSDDPTTDDFGPVQGMMISYSAGDTEQANKVFDALAEGGTVGQALIPTFFSPAFGMVTDRFGTPWMVTVDAPPEA